MFASRAKRPKGMAMRRNDAANVSIDAPSSLDKEAKHCLPFFVKKKRKKTCLAFAS